MKKAVLFLFILFFSACVFNNEEFFDTKKEILLRTKYLGDTAIISYLGVKNNKDYIVVASRKKIKQILIDGKNYEFKTYKNNQFNLPYYSDFFNNYFVLCDKSYKQNLILKLVFDDKELQTTLERISKSLNYHL